MRRFALLCLLLVSCASSKPYKMRFEAGTEGKSPAFVCFPDPANGPNAYVCGDLVRFLKWMAAQQKNSNATEL